MALTPSEAFILQPTLFNRKPHAPKPWSPQTPNLPEPKVSCLGPDLFMEVFQPHSPSRLQIYLAGVWGLST